MWPNRRSHSWKNTPLWTWKSKLVLLEHFGLCSCCSYSCLTSSLHQHWPKWWYVTYCFMENKTEIKGHHFFFFLFVFLQLQKHDREDEDVPSKWRTEAEMAAEASDLRDRLKDLWSVKDSTAQTQEQIKQAVSDCKPAPKVHQLHMRSTPTCFLSK